MTGAFDNQAAWHRLTDREREILAYVARHHQSKAIARKLGTAPKTVDAQISSACRKLGVANRNEAVRLFLDFEQGGVMGDHPLSAPSPMVATPPSTSPGTVATRGIYEDRHDGRDPALRPAASDVLSGFGDGAGAGRGQRNPQGHGASSRVGFAPAGAFSDGPDGSVRDPSLRQLPGGRSGRIPGFLTARAGWIRLGIAVSGSLLLAIGLPLSLRAALWLQQLVHALQ